MTPNLMLDIYLTLALAYQVYMYMYIGIVEYKYLDVKYIYPDVGL